MYIEQQCAEPQQGTRLVQQGDEVPSDKGVLALAFVGRVVSAPQLEHALRLARYKKKSGQISHIKSIIQFETSAISQ